MGVETVMESEENKSTANKDEEIKNLQNRLFGYGAMMIPPCFCCGYNGEGYYHPEKHPCAARHHKLYRYKN
uniref:Uncharacterized protein n=1 Tax=viral metagenome TaxID=1070528 RepID=A0A6M3KDD9_9ZZZZ